MNPRPQDPLTLSEADLERAVDAHADAIFRLALSQTGNPADAQDIVQDTFLKLLDRQEPFQDERHLRAWLIRVAINLVRDLQRTPWARRVQPLDEAQAGALAAREAPVEEAVIASLSTHPVWQALIRLPKDQRLVIHLRYVEMLDDATIARILGVSPVTVRTRLHRARKRLRAELVRMSAGTAPKPAPARVRRSERPASPNAPPGPSPQPDLIANPTKEEGTAHGQDTFG